MYYTRSFKNIKSEKIKEAISNNFKTTKQYAKCYYYHYSRQTGSAYRTVGIFGRVFKTEICSGGHVIAWSRQMSVVYRQFPPGFIPLYLSNTFISTGVIPGITPPLIYTPVLNWLHCTLAIVIFFIWRNKCSVCKNVIVKECTQTSEDCVHLKDRDNCRIDIQSSDPQAIGTVTPRPPNGTM